LPAETSPFAARIAATSNIEGLMTISSRRTGRSSASRVIAVLITLSLISCAANRDKSPFRHETAVIAVPTPDHETNTLPLVWRIDECDNGFGAKVVFARAPSGLKVVVEEAGDCPIVYCAVWLPAGSADDPKDKPGMAHVLEHCLFRNNEAEEGPVGRLRVMGAEINARTSLEHTHFHAYVSPDSAVPCVRELCALARRPSFGEEQFETEKEVICREIAMLESHPFVLASRLILTRLIPDHPLTQQIIGTEDSVRSITAAEAYEFYRVNYAPAQKAVITVVGPVKADSILKEVAAGWESELAVPGPNGPPAFDTPPVPPSPARREVRAATIVKQSYLVYGLLTDGWGNPDQAATDMLYASMGPFPGSFVHRKAVLEEGLTDFLISSHDYGFKDPLLMSNAGIYMFIAAGDEPKIRRLEKLIEDRAREMASVPLSDEEIAVAKARIKGSFLSIMQSTEARGIRYAYGEMYGRRFLPRDYLADIDAITPETMRASAERLFREDRQVVVAIDPARGLGVLMAIFRYVFLGRL